MVKSSEKINRIEQNKTSLELIKIGSKAEGIKADGFSIRTLRTAKRHLLVKLNNPS